MDYLNAAFGHFSPSDDKDAAVKFSLNGILMEDRLDDLACLLTDGHEIGGVEGVPGWLLERRDSGETGDMPGYALWPSWARFRAYVDPEEFMLGHAEYFMDEAEFHAFVLAALKAYANTTANKDAVTSIVARITA